MKRLEKIAREQATLVAETLADNYCVDAIGNLVVASYAHCNNCIFKRPLESCRSLMADWLLEEVAE